MNRIGDIIERGFISPLRRFIQDSRAVGIILIACTIFSLIISNTSSGANYLHFWEQELHVPVSIHLPHSILHIINDALMAVFFFLVGLEIKRELLIGELNSLKKSMLPVIAAVGGMLVPAIIYTLWCSGTPYARGWGIPMATDIAFSLGVLSLLGSRAPISLRIFLTALAIIDDLGGILTIAIFYAQDIHWFSLATCGGIILLLVLMNRLKLKRFYLFIIPGIALWYFIYSSGVHATIAGVLLAFTIPMPMIEKLEHALHKPVNFIILPLFALANTAIMLPAHFNIVFTSIVHHGILMGLVLGKPLGIYLFSIFAVRIKIASLPEGFSRSQLLGMGMIAGIGFTMSIFMATLAFSDTETQIIAKVAIIAASLLSGIIGFIFLRAKAL